MGKIELVKPEFAAGSEKRFLEFVKGINKKDKVAIISDTDGDGLASAKVVSYSINVNNIYFVSHGKITKNSSLVESLIKDNVNKIIILDHSVNDLDFIKEIEEFAEILIIDHHEIRTDLNSDRTLLINSKHLCTAYICYYLFSKIRDISKLDWLVACASISDWAYFNNQDFMKGVYSKYGDKFEITKDSIKKSGFFWDLQYNISLSIIYFEAQEKKVFDFLSDDINSVKKLEKYAEPIKNEINYWVDKFEEEKEKINKMYFWEFEPKYKVKSVVINIISNKYPDNNLIFGVVVGDNYNISARRRNGAEDVSKLLYYLIKGFKNADSGGHIAAAGAYILLKDKDEFKKRLKNL